MPRQIENIKNILTPYQKKHIQICKQVLLNFLIEAARIAATRYMKREGQLWIKIFPDKPITKKPLEVRMGKGKGAVEYWAAVVKPGRVLFEVGGVPMDVAKEALRLAAQKLPVKTKFVIARDYEA